MKNRRTVYARGKGNGALWMKHSLQHRNKASYEGRATEYLEQDRKES